MRTDSAELALAECITRFEDALRATAIRAALSILREGLGGRPARTEPRRVAAPPTEAPAPAGRKATWTRETIVAELATLMLGGTALDAAFVTRHGPRGLVAAARKTFGRFEAALNVAGLRVAQLHPDGPSTRRGR